MSRGFSLAASMAAFLLPACETLPAGSGTFSPSADARAVVQPSGPNVRINGVPAASPRPLAQGDVIVTGPGSTATIRFKDGATITLPPNTDPTFSWSCRTGPGPKGVIEVDLGQGWAGLVSGYRCSIRWVTQYSSGLMFSRGAVEARPDRTTAYLFEGRMRIERPLPPRDLAPMQLFEVGPTTPARVRPITPIDQRRVTAIFGSALTAPPQPAPPPGPDPRLLRPRPAPPPPPPPIG